MKWVALAGTMLAISLASPAYAVELPDGMIGSWTMANEEGNMKRAPEDEGGFYLDKEGYSGVGDIECDIKEIEKLGQAYIVRAHCQIPDNNNPWDEVVEFELRGDTLHTEPVGG